MPPTIAQDVASIIATRAEGFLEQYEGSGVINLTPAQKQALVSQLQGGENRFTLQGKKISLYTDPEWRSSAPASEPPVTLITLVLCRCFAAGACFTRHDGAQL